MPKRIGSKKSVRLFIAEWREKRDLTQQQLADLLQTSDVTISRWETGERSPGDPAKASIARALGIEVVDLFRHPDHPSTDELLRGQPLTVREQAFAVLNALIAKSRH